MSGTETTSQEKKRGTGWVENWRASIAIKTTGTLIYGLAGLAFVVSVLFLLGAEDRVRADYDALGDRVAYRVSSALAETPEASAATVDDALQPFDLVVLSLSARALVVGDAATRDAEENEASGADAGEQPVRFGAPPTTTAAPHLIERSLPMAPGGIRLLSIQLPAIATAVKAERTRVFVGIGLLTLILGFALVVTINRVVTDRIIRLEEVAEQMAAGHLDQRIDVSGNDEISRLGRAVNAIAGSLQATLDRVNTMSEGVALVVANVDAMTRSVAEVTDTQMRAIAEAAATAQETDATSMSIAAGIDAVLTAASSSAATVHQLSTSIAGVARSAEDLNIAAVETTSSVETMTSSIDLIDGAVTSFSHRSKEVAGDVAAVSSSVSQIETRAADSVKLADSARDAAAEGGAASAEAATSGMEEVGQLAAALLGRITTLGSSSADIGNVLNVINEVASRAQLLALNASIIASQAGEHGRSFSVVADEMKELADRTIGSTREISTLVTAVQEAIGDSVDLAGQVAERVSTGIDLIHGVNAALDEIIDRSAASSRMSQQIQAGTVEQTAAIQRINESIAEMSGAQIAEIAQATRDQSLQGRALRDTAEALKQMSEFLRTATREQSAGGADLTASITHFTDNIEQVKEASDRQRERQAGLLEIVGNVHQASERLFEQSSDLADSVATLQRQTSMLTNEMERYRS